MKSFAAAVAALLLGVLTNLVSTYVGPVADKRRRLVLSAFAGIATLSLILVVVTDEQVEQLQNTVGSWYDTLLRREFGWLLVLFVAAVLGTALFLALRLAVRVAFAPALEAAEKAYLHATVQEIDRLNTANEWKADYYVDPQSEIATPTSAVMPSYYLVQKLNPGVRKREFEVLPNSEKVENSRGLAYKSFKRAASRATDNAVVVLSAPGGGKTVTLRQLAKEYAEERLRGSAPIPVFVNLGFYTGWQSETEIMPFEEFLESTFASGYTSWLAGRKWETLLREGRCVFLLDGLDEIPRGTQEHLDRLSQVEKFVRAWPGTKFYLSCREIDYDYRLGFQQILIEPFDRKRIKRFLKLSFREQSDLQPVGGRLLTSASLTELAKVPFYLNLLCRYIRRRRDVPSNKSDLFLFVVNEVVAREVSRHDAQVRAGVKDRFVRVACELSAEMSLRAMTSTLALQPYLAGDATVDRDEVLSMIDLGIRGGLMELDAPGSTLRFAHHRFQEFFCSVYLTDQYANPSLRLPPDFFLSIWWRETILMVASIDAAPTDFVQVMLHDTSSYADRPESVAAAMRLTVLALAHECLVSNAASADSDLAAQTRESLTARFPEETPMGKVAIINALSEDSSPAAHSLLDQAVKDRSQWVSERAFYARSAGAGRFRPSPWSATKEFAYFLATGRIFANASNVFALATRFTNLRWLLPLYAVFALASVGTVVAVAAVLTAFGKFLVFDLQYSLSSSCLGCLANVSLAATIMVYFLTRQRPWAQRFLFAGPAALMSWFLVFTIPSEFFYRMLGVATGLYFAFLVRRRWPDPKSGEGDIFAWLAGLFAISALVRILSGQGPEARGPEFAGLSVGFSLLVILVILIAAGTWILRDLRELRKLQLKRKLVGRILAEHGPSAEAIALLVPLFRESSSAAWAQRALLDQVISDLSADDRIDEDARLDFLLRLGERFPPSRFRDVLYKRCEEVSDNLRRSLGRPTDSVLPEA